MNERFFNLLNSFNCYIENAIEGLLTQAVNQFEPSGERLLSQGINHLEDAGGRLLNQGITQLEDAVKRLLSQGINQLDVYGREHAGELAIKIVLACTISHIVGYIVTNILDCALGGIKNLIYPTKTSSTWEDFSDELTNSDNIISDLRGLETFEVTTLGPVEIV